MGFEKKELKDNMLKLYDPVTIKLANALLVGGECNRKDINILFETNRQATSYMYSHRHMFKIVKKKFKRTMQHYVRPIMSKVDDTPFTQLLKAIDPEKKALTFYVDKIWKNGRLGTEESKSYRNSMLSHTALLFDGLFDVSIWKRPTLREMNENGITIPVNTYYSPSELKWFSDARAQEFEYRNSISTGALVCENGTYVIYALRKKPNDPVIWREGTEERFLFQVEKIFMSLKCPNINKIADKLLLFGKEDIALAVSKALFSASDGVGLQLPGSVENAIYVPEDKSGREIVNVLAIPNYQEDFRNLYVSKERKITNSKTEDGYIDDEVLDENGNVVLDNEGNPVTEEKELLIWFDNDLSRLGAALNKTTRKIDKLMIYCLESQYELVIKVLALHESELKAAAEAKQKALEKKYMKERREFVKKHPEMVQEIQIETIPEQDPAEKVLFSVSSVNFEDLMKAHRDYKEEQKKKEDSKDG